MPDPIIILTAMGIAFAVAAVTLGAIGWSRTGLGSFVA